LALVFIALAESLGIEIILGAFLAGVIISLLSKKDDSIYFEKIDAIGYGFLIPIFFIMVGVGFDLQALLNSGSAMLLVSILIIIAFAVKLIPSLIYRFLFSWRETLAAGLLLSSRLSLIIAAAAIGLELGLISSAVNSAVILIAILSCTISPILFNRLIAVRNDDQERVIVIGSPEKGELVTQRLAKHDLEAVLVDLHNGYENPTGNSDQYVSSQEGLLDHLRSVSLETAQTIVALDDDDETNLRIARIAHHTFGLENIISWVTDPLQNPRFRRIGVRVLNPGFSNVLITESMVLNPDVYSVVSDVDETQEVREVKLQNPDMLNQSISEINLPEGVNVIMIERQGNLLVPEQKTVLRANDTITLVGKDIEEAVRSFVRES
jgi:Trk K+ transport system NAD-binding subunit